MNQTELESRVRRFIRDKIADGFTPLPEIVSDCVGVYGDECDRALLHTMAQRIFDTELGAFRTEQRHWQEVTDCDRLDAGFADLEAQGIICRHNFSCCGTCAAGEIWDEINAQRNLGREIRGCAHYNVQDTESGVEGYGICLSYGSVLNSDAASVNVGHEIVAALREHGLNVSWDGTIEKRIGVDLDWKRRRPELD